MKQTKALAMKIDSGITNSKDMQANLSNEIRELTDKLKHINTFSGAQQSNIEDMKATIEQDKHELKTGSSLKPISRTITNVVVWGAVMSTLYYILTV